MPRFNSLRKGKVPVVQTGSGVGREGGGIGSLREDQQGLEMQEGEPIPPSVEETGDEEVLSLDFLGRWGLILSHSLSLDLLESIFLQPAYLTFFAVFCAYIIGYFKLTSLWCIILILVVTVGASKILSRIVSTVLKNERLYGKAHRKEMYHDKESARWVNNMIVAVMNNHHEFISQILLRFLNPLLETFFTIPPVKSVEFQEMDIDEHTPSKKMKYDFDVDYPTNLSGTMKLQFPILPAISIAISDLTFKCRLRIEVTFLPEKFPFISTLRLSLLEQPEIDISVKLWRFPDLFLLPFVTEHYMKVTRRFMYQKLAAPNYIEIDLAALLIEEEGEGLTLQRLASVHTFLPELIRHQQVDIVKKQKRVLLKRAVHKMGKMATPNRARRTGTPVDVPITPNPLTPPSSPLRDKSSILWQGDDTSSDTESGDLEATFVDIIGPKKKVQIQTPVPSNKARTTTPP